MTDANVLCFGDSLTWGWVPVEAAAPTARYDPAVRWTGVLADRLGDRCTVIEEGLNGRTTTADDPLDPRLNAAQHLPTALGSHTPLDLVVLLLGTNDTKAYFHRTPFDIGVGMGTLVGQVLAAGSDVGTTYPAPQVLVVAPPPLGAITDPWFAQLFAGGREKSAGIAEVYRAMTSFAKVPFFDAGTVISTDGVDGIHLTEDNNRDLGEALADVVRDLLDR